MYRQDNDNAVRGPVNLHGLRVFLGGPIQHANMDGCFEPALRDYVLTFVAAIRDARGEVSSAHLAEQFGELTKSFTPDQVTVRDFTWMNECDVFVPILPGDSADGLLRTDGTHIELGWASALGKPIVLLTNPRRRAAASHLLRGLGTIASTTVLDIERTRADPSVLLDVLDTISVTLSRAVRPL